jgi:hypothetical protein
MAAGNPSAKIVGIPYPRNPDPMKKGLAEHVFTVVCHNGIE